jgi:hypothetical protein
VSPHGPCGVCDNCMQGDWQRCVNWLDKPSPDVEGLWKAAVRTVHNENEADAFERGRQAGLEEAARVVESARGSRHATETAAEAIRALAPEPSRWVLVERETLGRIREQVEGSEAAPDDVLASIGREVRALLEPRGESK